MKALDKLFNIELKEITYSDELPLACSVCQHKIFFHFNSYSTGNAYECDKCGQRYFINNKPIAKKNSLHL